MRFHTLDLMRGCAAIIVMLYHADRLVPRGYLAVDLFFVLSGFVLYRAYAERLRAGKSAAVLARRVIRLGPLLFAGLAVGWGVNGFPSNDRGFLFPANIPLWSLAFEIAASAAFVALFRFGALVWAAIWGAGLYFTLIGILEHRTADLGYTWDTAFFGLARTAFSFSSGLAIAKLPLRPAASWLGLPIAVIALVPTLVPTTAVVLSDIIAVLFMFPACVILAVRFDAPLVRLSTILGGASYALYAVHHPIVKAWAGWPVVVAVFVAAMALERFYDRPVRQWLSDRVKARTAAPVSV